MIEVLTDCRIWVGGHDLSGLSNNVTVSAEVAELDATTFASAGWNARVGGLKDGAYDIAGFSDPADPFDADLPVLTGAAAAVAVAVSDTVGARCYFGDGLVASGTRTVAVGQIPTLSTKLSGTGTRALLRGLVLILPDEITATGDGDAVQLGALTSDETLHASLQIVAAAGAVTVEIESSADEAFTSPTTRAAFTPALSGTEWETFTGPTTDTWWRATWSVASGTARVAVSAAII